LAAITKVIAFLVPIHNAYNKNPEGPQNSSRGTSTGFDLLNGLKHYLKNLENAEQFGRKLKLFSLSRHFAVLMYIV